MPEEIGRREVQRLLEEGAQLVEVLPREEFEEEHLPAAVNIPLRHLDEEAPKLLEPSAPTIVYCWDSA